MDAETTIPTKVWEEMVPRTYQGGIEPNPEIAAQEMVSGYLRLHAETPRTGLVLAKGRVADLARDAAGRLTVYMLRERKLVDHYFASVRLSAPERESRAKSLEQDVIRCTDELTQLYLHTQLPVATQKKAYVSLAKSAARHVADVFDRYCDQAHKALLADHIQTDIKALKRYHKAFK